jgi:methylmalonyl-CoA mutase N-terminal domain/subunit
VLKIDPAVERDQIERLGELKRTRDADAVEHSLGALAECARGEGNLMPPIVACARVGCTLGEIVSALREVFGTWREPQAL